MTVQTPHQRQQQIMQWLQEQHSLPIDELVNRLEVSAMTVHRDLDQLVKSGLVQKVYGAVELVDSKNQLTSPQSMCAMCRADIPYRTAFNLQTAAQEQVCACCPHCGLMLLQQTPQVASALTRDFIYGRMVNVVQASYVVESRVQLCCVPSVLCFATLEDAQAFQQGYGGQVMSFENTLIYLANCHSHNHSNHHSHSSHHQ